MPVCNRCGVAFLDGEHHACAGKPPLVVPLVLSVMAVVLPLALWAVLGYVSPRQPLPENAQWVGPVLALSVPVLLLSAFALGVWLIWRAWRDVSVVIGYVIIMMPVSFLFVLWFGVKFLGQDMP